MCGMPNCGGGEETVVDRQKINELMDELMRLPYEPVRLGCDNGAVESVVERGLIRAKMKQGGE